MAAFPTLSSIFGFKPDSKDFVESLENTALRTELEGGYIATRPKHTRAPRRMFKIVYRYLDNTDKGLLETHWNTQRGGSLAFDWVHPQTGTTFTVRYKSDKLEFRYVGKNTTNRWDCSFELEQA